MGIFKNDDQKSSQFGFDEKSMAGKASRPYAGFTQSRAS